MLTGGGRDQPTLGPCDVAGQQLRQGDASLGRDRPRGREERPVAAQLVTRRYLLISGAVVALRLREPNLGRPRRIPVGLGGIALVAGVPALVGVLVLFANGIPYLLAGGAAAATGPWRTSSCAAPREARGREFTRLHGPSARPIYR